MLVSKALTTSASINESTIALRNGGRRKVLTTYKALA
jgi:hypothetical protein